MSTSTLKIRELYPEEIDCRVGQVFTAKRAVSILLYKDARCDMAILDETFGPMNWQREHYQVKESMFCKVGIRNEGEWIWKADCGTESNTEAIKGESSDSFKRACVNWGIGRELYSAPFIYIYCTDKEWNGGKPRLDLSVATIHYNESREIDALVIIDKDGETRYEMGHYTAKKKEAAKEAAQEQAPSDVVASLEDAIDELKLCKSRKAVNAVNNKFKMYYGQYAEHPSERYMSTLKQMCNQYPIQQS